MASTIAKAINEIRHIKPEELISDTIISTEKETELSCEYIYQNGEKAGYIRMIVKGIEYRIELHLFGISVPAEIMTCNDYNLAMHKAVIMRNKYSY